MDFDKAQRDANIHVDMQGNSQQRTGTASSILNARSRTDSLIDTQKTAVINAGKEIDDYIRKIDTLRSKFSQLGQDAQKSLARTAEFKNLNKQAEALLKIEADIVQMYESGNASAKDLNDKYYESQVLLVDTRRALEDITDVYDEGTNSLKEQNSELQKSRAIRDAIARDTKKQLKEQAEQAKRDIDESNKSFSSALSKTLTGFSNNLQNLKQTIDLSSIANSTDRSASTKIQEDLQRAYGLNKAQFEDFKEDVSKSINTSIYSSEEVMKVYGSLLDLGLGNVDTASEQFNTILKGQSLLGMSAETQSQLIALGNKTGNDQLKFTTNRVAQYMKTATNISKEQLNQLISINANTASQMADLGVTSAEFSQSLDDTTVALTNYMKGDTSMAQSYNNAIGNSMNVDTAASMYGMSVEQMRSLYNNGGTLYDILDNGTGMAGQLYKLFKSDYDSAVQQSTYLQDSGAIDSSLAALIKQSVDIERQTGMSMKDFVNKYQTDNLSEEQLAEIEKTREEMLSPAQKIVNFLANDAITNADWVTIDTMNKSLGIIIGILTAINATVLALKATGITDSISNLLSGNGITSLFSGKGKGITGLFKNLTSNLKTLGNGKALSGLGKLASTGIKSIGKVAAPLAIASMAFDTFNGFTSTAESVYGTDATAGERVGMGLSSMVSGSTVHTDSKGNVSVGKNAGMGALSGAASGATLGAAIGGPVGLAIGAVGGALVGAIGGWFKGDAAKKEEEKRIQEEQLEEQKKINANTANTADQIKSLNTVNLVGNSYESSIPRRRDGAGFTRGPVVRPSYHKHQYNIGATFKDIGETFSGKLNQYLGPWRVSQPFEGPGDNQHKGIDLTAGGHQPIFASMKGIAYHVKNGVARGFGPYGVIVKNGQDEIEFAHMQARYVEDGQEVSPGTPIGLMGNMGNSTGQHLHLQVNRNGYNPVNPMQYVNDSLWNGDASAATSVDSSSSSSSSSNSLANDLLRTYTVQLGGTSKGATISDKEVVAGLAQINKTLLDLSNKQSMEQQIMSLLSGKEKPSPTMR